MTADYCADIKIVIFQYVLERQRDKCRTSSNCGRIVAKIERFNSENSWDCWIEVYQIWTRCTFWKRIYDRPIHCQMPNERVKVVPRDVDCTTSYVLNSGVSKPNLTKFLKGVQIWLLISLLKSKLWSSNSFGNANETNEDHRKIARFNSVNSQIIGQKFTKFWHNVARILPFKFFSNRIYDRPIHCQTRSEKKGRSWQCLRLSSKFNWLP